MCIPFWGSDSLPRCPPTLVKTSTSGLRVLLGTSEGQKRSSSLISSLILTSITLIFCKRDVTTYNNIPFRLLHATYNLDRKVCLIGCCAYFSLLDWRWSMLRWRISSQNMSLYIDACLASLLAHHTVLLTKGILTYIASAVL